MLESRFAALSSPYRAEAEITQMYAELSHDTAYETVRFGILLNEGCRAYSAQNEAVIERPASCVLFIREHDAIDVLREVFVDHHIYADDEVLKQPFDLLLGLSLLRKEQYKPPAPPSPPPMPLKRRFKEDVPPPVAPRLTRSAAVAAATNELSDDGEDQPNQQNQLLQQQRGGRAARQIGRPPEVLLFFFRLT